MRHSFDGIDWLRLVRDGERRRAERQRKVERAVIVIGLGITAVLLTWGIWI